jgi:hypothetical protein
MFQTAYPNIVEQYEAGPDGSGLPEEEDEPEEAAEAAA